MGKIRTRLVSAFCGVALAAGAPASAMGAGGVTLQLGGAVLCEAAAGFLGYGLAQGAFDNDGGGGYDVVTGGDVAGFLIGAALFAAYPLAAVAGTYFVGEKVGGPAANKGATFGITTFAAYGETLVLSFGAGLIGMAEGVDNSDAFAVALCVDAATKPVLCSYVYHKVKKPASAADSRLRVEPYVATARGTDGAPVPLYGITFFF